MIVDCATCRAGGRPAAPEDLSDALRQARFDDMPELHYGYSYYAALGIMAVSCVTLYVLLKRAKWL